MTKLSRMLLISMCITFGLCCLGLVGGMVYTLGTYFMGHRAIDQTLGDSIPFYKSLGALGLLGFFFFFLFLISSISPRRKRHP